MITDTHHVRALQLFLLGITIRAAIRAASIGQAFATSQCESGEVAALAPARKKAAVSASRLPVAADANVDIYVPPVSPAEA
jgi:hypothetical protein